MGKLFPFKNGKEKGTGIFVVGAARSGTTLLRLLINNHPDIACLGETHFFHHAYLKLGFDVTKNRSLFENVIKTESSQVNLLQDKKLIAQSYSSKTVASFFNLILSHYAIKEGKSNWAEKSPSHILRMEYIKKIFPDAKFINIVRNPFSTFISTFKNLEKQKISAFYVYSYLQKLKMLDKLVDNLSTKFPNDIRTVFYEDFSDNTLKELKNIFTFINVNSDINDEILHISKHSLPRNNKGKIQKHHIKVTNEIKENKYVKEDFLTNFQLYIFASELKNTKLYRQYINHEKLIIQYEIVRYFLKMNYYLFIAPNKKFKRFLNQFKASFSRVFS